MREAVVNEIEKLTKAGIARLSTSPWASPVVMVRKKDGGWRMCVYYRRLNSITKFDCFPLPRLDEALDAFAGATGFSLLDLAMAHHQVPVKPADVEKTAFITHVGLFKMAKMPFGLCNAPSTYQRLMMSVLQGLIGRICLVYLDDVIVFSKRRADHINDLRAVLDRIHDAGLKLNLRSAISSVINCSIWGMSYRQQAFPPIQRSCAYLLTGRSLRLFASYSCSSASLIFMETLSRSRPR